MPADTGATVAAPMRLEARALRRGLGAGVRVVRTGVGPRRSAVAARRLCPAEGSGLAVAGLAVAGVGGAVSDAWAPGDVAVAREVRSESATVRFPHAPLLTATARQLGVSAHCGTFWSAPHVVHGAARTRLAASGVDIVDMESAPLAAAGTAGSVVCVRSVVDTPRRPLFGPWTVTGGIAALRALAGFADVLRIWTETLGHHTLVVAPESGDLTAFVSSVDVVLLMGTDDSSRNTHMERFSRVPGSEVYRVDGIESISLAWLAGVGTIGLVADADASGGAKDELAEALRGLGPLTVTPWRDSGETTYSTRGEEVRR